MNIDTLLKEIEELAKGEISIVDLSEIIYRSMFSCYYCEIQVEEELVLRSTGTAKDPEIAALKALAEMAERIVRSRIEANPFFSSSFHSDPDLAKKGVLNEFYERTCIYNYLSGNGKIKTIKPKNDIEQLKNKILGQDAHLDMFQLYDGKNQVCVSEITSQNGQVIGNGFSISLDQDFQEKSFLEASRRYVTNRDNLTSSLPIMKYEVIISEAIMPSKLQTISKKIGDSGVVSYVDPSAIETLAPKSTNYHSNSSTQKQGIPTIFL